MSESKANKAIREELQERMKATAEKIQAVLLEDKFALQPFLARSEYGDTPQVRLVDTSNDNTDANKEPDTIEADGAEVKDEPTATESA